MLPRPHRGRPRAVAATDRDLGQSPDPPDPRRSRPGGRSSNRFDPRPRPAL